MRFAILYISASAVFPAASVEAPVFEVTPTERTIKFDVEASGGHNGQVRQVGSNSNIHIARALNCRVGHQDSGCQRRYGKRHEKRQVKGQRFLRCRAKSINHLSLDQNDTNRSRHHRVRWRLHHPWRNQAGEADLTITGKGTGSGTIAGTMAFDRKQYGMNSGIPFIKIADRPST
jgi:polyisoprenoid-binding protein YceI